MELTSRYNISYLNKWIEINRALENEVLIMFGLGTGMFLKAFLSDEECEGKLVIVEPDADIVDTLMEDKEYRELLENDRVNVLVDNLSDNFFNNFLYNNFSENNQNDSENLIRFKAAIYPNYHLIYKDEVKRFLDTVDEVSDMIKASISVNNRFSDAIEKNITINEKRLSGSLSLIELNEKLPKDIPVIIAASGPSLSKNITELKRAKGRCFIVGLDSSLPALLKEDIVPDMYISIDPTKYKKHFEDERIKNIPVIAMLQSPEHVIKEGQKYFYIFGGDEKVLPTLKENGIQVVEVPALGSVANTAFTLMNMMDFKTIIFVGQDLAYTDNKYHADNTVHLETTFKTDTIITLPGIDGSEVKSSREFRMYKTGFEKIIEMFPEHRFIDATEGGAYIIGTELMSLKLVVDSLCVTPVDMSLYFDDISLIGDKDVIEKSILLNTVTPEQTVYELSKEIAETGNLECVDKLYDYVSQYDYLKPSMLYLFYQIRRLYFTNVIGRNKSYYALYEAAYMYWKETMQPVLHRLPNSQRNMNRVVVITLNFLGNRHAPTRTALERIKALVRDLGKEVLVINAKEEISQVGKIDFYNCVEPNSIEEYNGLNEIEHEGIRFKMYQPACNMPDYNECGIILSTIREFAPYEAIVIGDNCILGDLCAEIVPTVCLPVVFSDIAYKPYSDQFVMVTHNNFSSVEFDQSKMKKEQFIEGIFTFELKPQTKKLTRNELNIPNDKFVISIVGIRLHHDVSEEFLRDISSLFDKGIHLAFAGHFDNYEILCEKINGLKEHSTFVGYQNDMLAFQEICDLYINPPRLGGGFSVVEAFYMHKPGITLDFGDVSVTAGNEFCVDSVKKMKEEVCRYVSDKKYYDDMSDKAYKRSLCLLDCKMALENVLNKMEGSSLFF